VYFYWRSRSWCLKFSEPSRWLIGLCRDRPEFMRFKADEKSSKGFCLLWVHSSLTPKDIEIRRIWKIFEFSLRLTLKYFTLNLFPHFITSFNWFSYIFFQKKGNINKSNPPTFEYCNLMFASNWKSTQADLFSACLSDANWISLKGR